MVLHIGRSDKMLAVAFHPDGKHVLGGNDDGIRRWRLADGQEVGKQTGMRLLAISVSRDDKWIVCGTHEKGASVWDREIQEKILNVEDENVVDAVDFSPDSMRFATGTRPKEASIWSITTGQRLVGPLEHESRVMGLRFSPNGERIATACFQGIRIFDTHTGDKLVTINTDIRGWAETTPLAWSNDGQQIFAVSRSNKIRALDASTGTRLVESRILDYSYTIHGIALAANSKFITTCAGHSVLFLDTSTLGQIGPVIDDGEETWSVALSPDSSHLAAGRPDAKIVIRDLGKILPVSYGPFNVSVCALILLACRISPVSSLTLTKYVSIYSRRR